LGDVIELNRILLVFCMLGPLLKAEPASAVTPASVAKKMARQLFADSGYTVVVRRTEQIAECKQISEGGNVWVVPQEDMVTDFLYSSRAICVSVLVRSEEPGAIRFESQVFEEKFGTVPTGQFQARQRSAFVFSDDTPPDETALAMFFRQVPRPVNLDHPGSLTSAMKEIESSEAGSKFAGELSGSTSSPSAKAAADKTAFSWPAMPGMPTLVLLASAGLCGAALFLFVRARSQSQPVPSHADELQHEAEPIEDVPEPVPVARAKGPKRLGRRMLALPVTCAEDQKAVTEIDALILRLTTDGSVKWGEADEILKKAHAISAEAVKQNLPSLEIVKQFLTEQVREAQYKNGPWRPDHR
jgi:hypothetical protein